MNDEYQRAFVGWSYCDVTEGELRQVMWARILRVRLAERRVRFVAG